MVWVKSLPPHYLCFVKGNYRGWSEGTGKLFLYIFSTVRKSEHKTGMGEFCSPNSTFMPFLGYPLTGITVWFMYVYISSMIVICCLLQKIMEYLFSPTPFSWNFTFQIYLLRPAVLHSVRVFHLFLSQSSNSTTGMNDTFNIIVLSIKLKEFISAVYFYQHLRQKSISLK